MSHFEALTEAQKRDWVRNSIPVLCAEIMKLKESWTLFTSKEEVQRQIKLVSAITAFLSRVSIYPESRLPPRVAQRLELARHAAHTARSFE